MRIFAENVSKMDSSIGNLIEIANKINNEQSRLKAIEISKHAREMEEAYSSLHTLYGRRFDLQISVLNELISLNGDLSTIVSFKRGAGEITSLVNESDVKWRQAAKAWNDTKDSFSSLKGMSNLTIHKGKYDSESDNK